MRRADGPKLNKWKPPKQAGEKLKLVYREHRETRKQFIHSGIPSIPRLAYTKLQSHDYSA